MRSAVLAHAAAARQATKGVEPILMKVMRLPSPQLKTAVSVPWRAVDEDLAANANRKLLLR